MAKRRQTLGQIASRLAPMIGGLLLLPQVATAQMNQVYQWVDDQGVTHYSQTLNNIPEGYRSQAARLSPSSLPGRPAPALQPPNSTRPPAETQTAPPARQTQLTEEEWQLALDLRARLQALAAEEIQCRRCAERVRYERTSIQAALFDPQILRDAVQRARQRLDDELALLLSGLQRVAGRLRGPEPITYDDFIPRIEGFQKDLEAFKIRHRRSLGSGQNPKLVKTLLDASEILIASAESWKREIRNEREAAEIQRRLETLKRQPAAGSSPPAQRSVAQYESELRAARWDRDEAAKDRMARWDALQRLVEEASSTVQAK